jgi:hypothetical protein
MARTNASAEFEIEVAGEPYVWWLQRRPQWSSDPAQRRGMGIAARHKEGGARSCWSFPRARSRGSAARS